MYFFIYIYVYLFIYKCKRVIVFSPNTFLNNSAAIKGHVSLHVVGNPNEKCSYVWELQPLWDYERLTSHSQ